MPEKAAYLLAVPGFADWEPAHALAELRRSGGYRVEVVGLDSAPVESMGGLTVEPSRTLADVDPADVAIFILPGGDYWEQEHRHTSNGLSYLRERVPEYAAARDYVDAPSMRDDHLITANGLADVEFARDIMAELGVFSEEDRVRWTRLFRSGHLDGRAS